ncbi:MAG: lamin tail domain-containing protein [bacterium]
MMVILTIFTIFIFFSSCEIAKPEVTDYDPFFCEKFPEERVYYPEEKITFIFNMEVNPSTIAGFKAKEEETGDEIQVEIVSNTVSILPPLPAESSVLVTITSALKSIDNRPLMTSEAFSEHKKPIELAFETGVKLPEIEEVIPSDTQSATVALRFDGNIEIKFKEIEPAPVDMIKVGKWIVLIYDKPVKKINILKANSLDREAELENIVIELPSKKPEKGELSIEYFSSDTEIEAKISDESAIAASINGVNFMCEGGCAAILKDLSPEQIYVLETKVFTTTGPKTEKEEIATDEEKPHIMITEVMHTPSLEPEKNWEFVEIYNYSNLDFDLTDCFIDDGNDGKGIDPLILKDPERELVLRPGELAVITGNAAAFSDLIGSALWLVVDDTTIADAGLTSKESVQIICNREDQMILEANADPSELKTARGFSFNADRLGNICPSKNEGGTPGKYYECD